MVPRIDLNLNLEASEEETAYDIEAEPEEEITVEGPAVTTPKPSTDDEEGVIPFRTSKRLQGAIYRMIQERDGRLQAKNTLTIDTLSSARSASRSLKKQQRSQSPERIDVKEESREACLSEGSTVPSDSAKEILSPSKKRKNCTVRFADPLFAYIEDKKEAVIRESTGKQQAMISNKAFLKSRKSHHADEGLVLSERSAVTTGDDNHRKHRPLSCFDLFCNYVGQRGWRCYRSSMDGKSFCKYHQDRKPISLNSRILQTV